jgi:hypothetical protein
MNQARSKILVIATLMPSMSTERIPRPKSSISLTQFCLRLSFLQNAYKVTMTHRRSRQPGSC